MTSRILNRRVLRKQGDQAEDPGATPPAAAPAGAAPRKKAKAPAKPRAKKPRAKKPEPRMRARWGVFDGGLKQVAIFDYNQRGAAEEELAHLLAAAKGTHFMQLVKEPMPEPEPAVAAAPGGNP